MVTLHCTVLFAKPEATEDVQVAGLFCTAAASNAERIWHIATLKLRYLICNYFFFFFYSRTELISESLSAIFHSPTLTACYSNLLNRSRCKSRPWTTLADVWSPRWICDNRFLCYLHAGLCSQIAGISGLTRELHIVLD